MWEPREDGDGMQPTKYFKFAIWGTIFISIVMVITIAVAAIILINHYF